MGRALAGQAERGGGLATARDDLEAFEVLRELTNNGYAVHGGDDRSSGVRLRHDSAPDLILHADGRIEVPLGQPRKSSAARFVPGAGRGMSWRRTIAIALLIGMVWIISAFLTATFFEM